MIEILFYRHPYFALLPEIEFWDGLIAFSWLVWSLEIDFSGDDESSMSY